MFEQQKKPNLNDETITHPKYKKECDNKANYPKTTLNENKLSKTKPNPLKK